MCRTGETLARLPGYSAANSIYVDGRLIVLDDGGRLSLIDTAGGGLQVVSSFQLLDSRTWTVPTLIGTTLYVRDRESILALALR